MAESTNPLVAFSDHAAQLVERTASGIVAVHGGGRGSSSGIHWRSGVIVTAEEVLERDEDIKITLPSGRLVEASLAGRDPSTDVAVLRFQPDGLPAAPTADAAPLRPGHVVLASTIDRVVDQLLARGHVFRGYLGAGLQPVRHGRPLSHDTQPSGSGRGVLVVSIDPEGPAARAGLLVGDIVMAWNEKPVDRVREVMRLLGANSAGNTVDLGLIRGGAPTAVKVVIGERAVA